MSKKDELLYFCKSLLRPFSSVEVNDWGCKNFYLRSKRTVQEFAADLKVPIRRIPKEECIMRGLIKKGMAPLAFYEVGRNISAPMKFEEIA